jgi:phospholipase D1/2
MPDAMADTADPPAGRRDMHPGILRPGRNVWRIARADRAAVLIDGAAFFGAVRAACLKAQRSIFIVGWDIDSRTRLVGADDPSDGYPPVLADFLSELVRDRPELHVYILLWDYSVVYAAERELFSRLSLQWMTPERVTLCMDDAVPFGSSQHQKLIVVDDAVAFSGGLDVTQRRWDTADHAPTNPARVDAEDRAYPPFHDVQMMVDGEAAHALAVLARRRWCNAYGTQPPVAPSGDPWPDHLPAHFAQVDVGIARTQPAFGDQTAVREVEALFLDAIDAAERSIYIENQFMTSHAVVRRLARRLRQRRTLEVVAVGPRAYDSKIVAQTLGKERADFRRTLAAAGGDRVRLVYPAVDDGRVAADTMVHSKVMIVDDRFLRIGSANLNNRSMGVDTECDLAIEAHDARDRAAIAHIRNTLLGHHCGAAAGAVAAELARTGSLVGVADRMSVDGHALRRIDDGPPDHRPIVALATSLLDPARKLTPVRVWRRIRPSLPERATMTLLLLAAAIAALTVVWYATPASELVTRERMQALLSAAEASAWAPLWVVLTYVIAGAVAFPLLVLIVATAAVFGPWLGFLYALSGALASALAMYAVGAWAGRDALRALLGARWQRIRREIDDRGMLAVAAIRLVPVAPYTLVNLIAGACAVRLLDYVAGTVIGLLPGLIAISALGHQISAIVSDFSAEKLGVLVLLVAGWVAMAWGAQALAGRLRKRNP